MIYDIVYTVYYSSGSGTRDALRVRSGGCRIVVVAVVVVLVIEW